MSETVADRYARAIFEVGEDANKLDRLANDIAAFAQAYESSSELRSTLGDPLLDEERRTSVLKGLASRLGACDEALNSVRVMMRRHRMSELSQVARKLTQLTDEKTGLLRVQVLSAKPLGEGYYADLAREIGEATGRKIAVDKKIDESLIAGVVVRIGARTIDGSLKGRLDEFEQKLSRAS